MEKQSKIAKYIANISRIYRQSEKFFSLLVGLPSYEKYKEHHEKYHPNCPIKSRKEFFLDSQDKRYGRGGGKRCC
ncbi:YbdD/YjiX family protein [Helicobacter muridarum]|uniref:YbdD/YjiX family protein n=1 Tax=Helicobacter muridarum TaxID=216 RepID=A0A377PUB7_9HELI|nr:YbdD/YjiX family protein [Helicobacter muridarum]TLE01569.1 YbdD/YjiX family protein [Helicobacter muridarum]STQ86177.1 Uncharacterized small protein [Helicobacter muridarum]